MQTNEKQVSISEVDILSEKKKLILSQITLFLFILSFLFFISFDVFGLTFNLPILIISVIGFTAWTIVIYSNIELVNYEERFLIYQVVALFLTSFNSIGIAVLLFFRDINSDIILCIIFIVGLYILIFVVYGRIRINKDISYTDNIERELVLKNRSRIGITYGFLGIGIARFVSRCFPEYNIFLMY